MNIDLISGQIALLHITLETAEPHELYGGTTRGAFSFERDGETWHVTAREEAVAGVPLCNYDIYARELSTGREWVILSGKIIVKPRTASVPDDKLHPVEYFVTVPVRNSQVDAAGNVIVQGIPGPKGERGEKGDPGEGGVTEEERALLNGAAQRDADNTFTAGNTFTGAVDMSEASVTPPSGWNVGELTPEAIQQVVPIAWHNETVKLGEGSIAEGRDVSLGKEATAYGNFSLAAGFKATSHHQGVGIGGNATAAMNSVGVGRDAYSAQGSVACGYAVKSNKPTTVTLGAYFVDTEGTHTCTTVGTGSITIGAGANTLNNGDVESSNSVTIGCKAENKGADSVVIGASAKVVGNAAIAIGAGAEAKKSEYWGSGTAVGTRAKANLGGVAIGRDANSMHGYAVTVGNDAKADYSGTSVGNTTYSLGEAVAIGYSARAEASNSHAYGAFATAKKPYSIAIGGRANVSDYGATVIRSTAEDGTYTQLYFSGANTPLANTYHGGAPMLGYVTKDSAGNIVAAGTRSLIDLLTDNSTFAPASLDENGEWVAPTVFHPSDLDMPTEEPTEPEDYTPLPVYPIVEPEIEDLIE